MFTNQIFNQRIGLADFDGKLHRQLAEAKTRRRIGRRVECVEDNRRPLAGGIVQSVGNADEQRESHPFVIAGTIGRPRHSGRMKKVVAVNNVI